MPPKMQVVLANRSCESLCVQHSVKQFPNCRRKHDIHPATVIEGKLQRIQEKRRSSHTGQTACHGNHILFLNNLPNRMENTAQILTFSCVRMSPQCNQITFIIRRRPPSSEPHRFCQQVVSVLPDSHQSTGVLRYFEHSIPDLNAEAMDVLSHNIRSVIVIPR